MRGTAGSWAGGGSANGAGSGSGAAWRLRIGNPVALCSRASLAETLARTFGFEPVDTAGLRETTEEHLALAARALTLRDKALQLHLRRVVGAYVGSAYGAGQFYSAKVTQARDLTAKGSCDARDEDRDGVAGFESKAERARAFAAEMGLQAHALLAAAEGAVSAYAHLTGEDWKPYEAPLPAPAAINCQGAAAQMAAFRKEPGRGHQRPPLPVAASSPQI